MTEDRDLSLVETLDHLLDRGVVIAGEAVISIGDVDLLYLGLNIVLANVDTLIRAASRPPGGTEPQITAD
ncbi:MAG: gas vesicle protein [Thermoanaerobaculia bacterium]